MAEILTYTGKNLAEGNEVLGLDPYIPSQELVRAVNIALLLKKRPLLLMGEPGVGKTRLAESVAFEILGPDFYNTDFFRWDIKSTTKAKDGLYRYDTFSRLADSQILLANDRAKLNNLRLGAHESYIQMGVLAKAFANSTIKRRTVILIDEIDKADIDFPNDLLNELENYNFTIPETGEKIVQSDDFDYPIIIITSNRERELPPAFLRRCLYHFINFPDDKILSDIIGKKFGKKHDDELVRKALKAFKGKRADTTNIEKKPSTSELLDWFNVLNHYNDLKANSDDKRLSDYDRDMIKCLDLLDTAKIPFAEVLLKTYETYTGNESPVL